jgi:hypothetical protein
MEMMHATKVAVLRVSGGVSYRMFGFFQDNPALSVAVKTCKNSTSDSVREKFLQEACEFPVELGDESIFNRNSNLCFRTIKKNTNKKKKEIVTKI